MAGPHIRDEQGRFPPGVSGNPAGRPKNTIRDAIRALLTETDKQQLAKAYLQMAYDDPRAMRSLIEDHDGKLPTPLTGVPDGDPIALIIQRPAPEPEAG